MVKGWLGKNKRGSLNLSIEAIVIVVIAFVVLGLGLGFVKGQFEQITDTSSSVQTQIAEQIQEDLRRSNNKLSFPSNDLTYETKEEDVQAVGIKNTNDQSKFFKLGFQVNDGTAFVDFEPGVKLTFGSDSAEAEILWDNSAQNLAAGDTQVISFSLVSPSKQGTYLYKAVLEESEDGATWEEYDSTTFFIKTS
ncbi:hypothetical protein CL619_04805 [archaeon]|nr:hypothetical protein [archaeon]